jgi:hypothetical protein
MLFSLPIALLTWGISPPAADAQNIDGNIKSFIVLNNTTSVAVITGNHWVTSVEVFNNSTTIAWLKLYDSATATCGSGTPVARYMIPGNTNGAGGIANYTVQDRYVSGIVACVTTGIVDADTAAPAATTYVWNIHWR